MAADDEVMRPCLEKTGTWEPDLGAFLRRYFTRGLRFLDVGAGFGYFTRYVAKHCPSAVIHAFEPHPVASHVLALNVWAAKAEITVHPVALTAGERLVALRTNGANMGDTRCVEMSGSDSLSWPHHDGLGWLHLVGVSGGVTV
ncbi:MAG: hypothetical protein V9F82_10190 [Dermatophilaceae bacterium]